MEEIRDELGEDVEVEYEEDLEDGSFVEQSEIPSSKINVTPQSPPPTKASSTVISKFIKN
jgi:hypothetical protein